MDEGRAIRPNLESDGKDRCSEVEFQCRRVCAMPKSVKLRSPTTPASFRLLRISQVAPQGQSGSPPASGRADRLGFALYVRFLRAVLFEDKVFSLKNIEHSTRPCHFLKRAPCSGDSAWTKAWGGRGRANKAAAVEKPRKLTCTGMRRV